MKIEGKFLSSRFEQQHIDDPSSSDRAWQTSQNPETETDEIRRSSNRRRLLWRHQRAGVGGGLDGAVARFRSDVDDDSNVDKRQFVVKFRRLGSATAGSRTTSKLKTFFFYSMSVYTWHIPMLERQQSLQKCLQFLNAEENKYLEEKPVNCKFSLRNKPLYVMIDKAIILFIWSIWQSLKSLFIQLFSFG